MSLRSHLLCIAPLLAITLLSAPLSADELALQLRFQQESPAGSGRFQRLERAETWPTAKTAVIVCDV